MKITDSRKNGISADLLKYAKIILFFIMTMTGFNIFSAEPILRIAVASNFLNTATKLVDKYQQSSLSQVELISGSTGKLFAQINRGAPYDIFFAADELRPKLLSEAKAEHGPLPYVYAVGILVFWAPDLPAHHEKCNEELLSMPFTHIAIANTKTAPYGYAAIKTLQKLGKLQSIKDKLVFGENVGQVLSYLVTGAVEAGFLSLSQVREQDYEEVTCVWKIPRHYYQELAQSAIILQPRNLMARDFMNFLQSEQAREVIQSSGYFTP